MKASLLGAGLDSAAQLDARLSAAHHRETPAIDGGDPPGPWLRALDRLVHGVVA